MSAIKTTLSPPQIRQHLDPLLLSMPTPDFRESTKTLDEIYRNILKRWHKIKPWHIAEAERLKTEFLELYERAKTKEIERKKEKDHKTQEPFYRIECLTKDEREILFRFRFR